MSEIISNIKLYKGSEKEFGLVFGFVFFIIGFYPLIKGDSFPNVYALIASIFFYITAFLFPNILFFS